MPCEGDSCSSLIEPKIKFARLYDLFFNSFHCSSQKLLIRGHQLNSLFFTNGKTDCLPNSLFCQTDYKTFIWKKIYYTTMPFLLINEIKLNFTDSFAISSNLFFQIQNKIFDCNMNPKYYITNVRKSNLAMHVSTKKISNLEVVK